MTLKVEERDVPLDQLMLDPNNPRYADLDVARQVPESKVHEPSVQATARSRMLEERFDVAQLKKSIQSVGFLRVDRLVVTELPEKASFLVVEGNRRLAALKSLLDDEASGEITLNEPVRQSIVEVPVVVVRGESSGERNQYARTLQGLRHLPGVKPWGPYQQAQMVGVMLAEGRDLLEIREMLGLTAQRANSLRRVFYALEQMKDDAEYGEFAKPHLFSNFEEALKLPKVREWLGWDDVTNRITNDQHRHFFYSWLVGIEEDGERRPPKVIDAKDLRLLPRLLDNPAQQQQFIEDASLSLREASRFIPDPEPAPLDWRSALQNTLNTLKQIPAVEAAAASEADIQLLNDVVATCRTILDQIGDASPASQAG